MLKTRPILASIPTRAFRPQRAQMSTVTPNFSPGSDAVALGPAVTKLVSRPQSAWRLTATGEGVERSFKFKTFAKTWVRSPHMCSPCLRTFLGGTDD